MDQFEVWQSVCQDIMQRNQLGLEKYGKPLLPHDGRRTLQDAYEEALDQAMYLKKCIMEACHLDDAEKLLRGFPFDSEDQMIDWMERREHFLKSLDEHRRHAN